MSNAKAMKEGRRFSCPSCAGGLRYDIAERKMRCDRCEKTITVAELPDDPPADEQETMEVTAYCCPQCGAEIYSADTEATAFCNFCGSDVVLTERIGRMRRPDGVVPFRITREQCEAAYLAELKHHYLAPPALKDAKTIAHFRPVYIPFWSCSVKAEGEMNLSGTKASADGHWGTQKYTLTNRANKITLNANISQTGILNDASTLLEDEISARLRTTEKDRISFHSGYLSGLYALAPDVPAEIYRGETEATALRNFMYKVKAKYDLDYLKLERSNSKDDGLPNPQFQEKLIMLPVWLLAHREGQRMMYTAVNGRTGEVVCDILISFPKVIALVALFAALLSFLLSPLSAVNPDLLIMLCSAVTAAAQFLFNKSMDRLDLRKRKLYDPDLSRSRVYGPARALLQQNGISATVGEQKTAEQKFKSRYMKSTYIVLGVIFGGIGIAYLMLWGVFYAVCMIAALIAMIFLQDDRPAVKICRILSIIACAAGLINLLIGLEIVNCCCMAVMVLSVIWELASVIKARNEYASRPIPFLKDQEVPA